MADPTNVTHPVPNPDDPTAPMGGLLGGAIDAATNAASSMPPPPDGSGAPDWWNSGMYFGEPGTGDPGAPDHYVEGDPFQFDTIPGSPGPSQYFGYDDGGAGPTVRTWQTGGQHTVVNPDGSVSIAGGPVTREVQDEELVSNQMDKLLNSDSKYMQDARRQGAEQAAAMGGLGGTAGIGASMQAAVRAGLPIAQADAQAMQVAASENMAALNQYAQMNLDRATQLEQSQIGAKSQLKNTQINASLQHSISRLEDIRARDLSQLDAETQLRVTEMNGQIQSRMAAFQHQYNSLLEDQRAYQDLMRTKMQGDYTLADKELSGRWEMAIRTQEAQVQRSHQYITAQMGSYEGMMDRIAALNGLDMDNTARTAAINSIKEGFLAQQEVMKVLYPDMPAFDWADSPASGTP